MFISDNRRCWFWFGLCSALYAAVGWYLMPSLNDVLSVALRTAPLVFDASIGFVTAFVMLPSTGVLRYFVD